MEKVILIVNDSEARNTHSVEAVSFRSVDFARRHEDPWNRGRWRKRVFPNSQNDEDEAGGSTALTWCRFD